MGISGLLPLLKDIQTPKHVADYRGQTLGIDAYVWLHRGAYGCAREIVHNEPTDRYIAYAVGRIRMLQHHGVKPYIVFDGDKLPAKQGTEDDREHRRTEYLEKARELERAGKLTEARDIYAKCVDITPEMAFQLIKFLRREGIPYVVAPYEADAQLAFLERQGTIDGIITEDSDLLVFGCEKVLFKLDQGGHCIEILRARFAQTRQVILSGWTPVEFRQMAILSGCDYLPSIVGMGLKNAHRLLRRYKTVDKVLQAVRLEGKMRVPNGYAREFRKAELTFVHQRVWDPAEGKMATLTPLPDGTLDEMVPFIGAPIDEELAQKIAEGDVDPVTRLPMVDLLPAPKPVVSASNARSTSWASSGSSSARPTAFSRSTTVAGPSGSALSPFYRASIGGPAKKQVSNEAGLQTIKNFFGAKSTQTKTAKAAQGVAATVAAVARAAAPAPAPRAVPLSAKDTNAGLASNRELPLDPFAVTDKGKRKADDWHDGADSASQGQENNPDAVEVSDTRTPVQSKFFKKASAAAGSNAASTDNCGQAQPRNEAALSNYLELDGRTPRRSNLLSSQATPSKVWEGCADMDDFLKFSPSQRIPSDAPRQRSMHASRMLGDDAAPSSSPFATPQDDAVSSLDAPFQKYAARSKSSLAGASVVVHATPTKRKRKASGYIESDDGDDSDHSSGFISSPASSVRPQRHRRLSSGAFHDNPGGGGEDEDEDDTMPSSPVSPIKARGIASADTTAADLMTSGLTSTIGLASTSVEAHASSDPIEADEESQERAAQAVGRGLMAQFGWKGSNSPPTASSGGKSTTPAKAKISPPPPMPLPLAPVLSRAATPRQRLPERTPSRPSPAGLALKPLSNRTPTNATTPSATVTPEPGSLSRLDAFRFRPDALGDAPTRSGGREQKRLTRTVSDSTDAATGQAQGESKRARPTPPHRSVSCSSRAKLSFAGDEIQRGGGGEVAEGLGAGAGLVGVKINRLERFRFGGCGSST